MSFVDPLGLFPPALFLAAGILGSLGLGLGGAYGAAKITDTAKTYKDGKESTVARDAIKEVAPYIVRTHKTAFLPGELTMGAVTGGLGRVLATKGLIELVQKGKKDSSQHKK